MLLDIALVAVFVLCIIINAKKGFVKSALGVLGLVLAVIIVINAGDAFAEYMTSTQSGRAAESKIYNITYDRLYVAENAGKDSVSKALSLPPFINEKLQTDDLTLVPIGQISADVAKVVYGFLCKAVLFLILAVLFFVAKLIVPQVFKLPGLKQLNGVCGAIFGVVNGVFFVYMIMLALYAVQSFYDNELLIEIMQNSKIYAFVFLK